MYNDIFADYAPINVNPGGGGGGEVRGNCWRFDSKIHLLSWRFDQIPLFRGQDINF